MSEMIGEKEERKRRKEGKNLTRTMVSGTSIGKQSRG